jgi:DNA-binding GntR family transcriptional regulator
LAVATTQTEKAYRLLREKLMAGELEPGQRLVNRQLATEFGISVIPLREAISRLASEGLIQQIPGSGSFVRSTDEREMEELITFRACIESGAAAEAAANISARQLDSLRHYIEEWEALAKKIAERSDQQATNSQIRRWMEIEEAFHTAIVEASRNRFLAGASRDHQVLARFFEAESQRSGLTAEDAAKTSEGHRRLLEVIATGDPDAARQEMARHLAGER